VRPMMRDRCGDCSDVLIGHFDDDPSGREATTCARCVAEQGHDFDAEPGAIFRRGGDRMATCSCGRADRPDGSLYCGICRAEIEAGDEPEDSRPVTNEWLQTMATLQNDLIRVVACADSVSLYRHKRPANRIKVMASRGKLTRGKLRRICAALGVPMDKA
jgi:hypothetical protein